MFIFYIYISLNFGKSVVNFGKDINKINKDWKFKEEMPIDTILKVTDSIINSSASWVPSYETTNSTNGGK